VRRALTVPSAVKDVAKPSTTPKFTTRLTAAASNGCKDDNGRDGKGLIRESEFVIHGAMDSGPASDPLHASMRDIGCILTTEQCVELELYPPSIPLCLAFVYLIAEHAYSTKFEPLTRELTACQNSERKVLAFRLTGTLQICTDTYTLKQTASGF
jgi:hypothetical protein